jgi:hypothetical protein
MKKTPFPQAQMLDSQGVLHEWHWPVHNPAPGLNSVDKALKCLGDSRHGMPADKPTNCAIEPLYRFEAATCPTRVARQPLPPSTVEPIANIAPYLPILSVRPPICTPKFQPRATLRCAIPFVARWRCQQPGNERDRSVSIDQAALSVQGRRVPGTKPERHTSAFRFSSASFCKQAGPIGRPPVRRQHNFSAMHLARSTGLLS